MSIPSIPSSMPSMSSISSSSSSSSSHSFSQSSLSSLFHPSTLSSGTPHSSLSAQHVNEEATLPMAHKRMRTVVSLKDLVYSLVDCGEEGYLKSNSRVPEVISYLVRTFLPSEALIGLRSVNRRMISEIDSLKFIPYLKHTRELSLIELERYSVLAAQHSLIERQIVTFALLRQKRQEILQGCKNLSSFKIDARKVIITHRDLIEHLTVLKLEHPHLKHLKIFDATKEEGALPLILTDGIINLLAGFGKLETFCFESDLPGDSHIPFQINAWVNAVKQWPALVHFELPPGNVGDELLVALGSYCPRLEILNLEHFRCSDRAIQAITKGCPELKKLNLYMENITEAGLQLIKNCRKLRVLSLTNPFCIPREGFGPSLVEVNLETAERIETLEPFANSPALTSISVHGAELAQDVLGLSALAHCSLLKTLRFTASNLSDTSLKVIQRIQPRLVNLNYIEIAFANSFTNPALETFKRLLSHIEIEVHDLEEAYP